MKRISIRISDELHEQIRQRAFKERKSINSMVEELFISLDMEDPTVPQDRVITVAPKKIATGDLSNEFHPQPKGGE